MRLAVLAFAALAATGCGGHTKDGVDLNNPTGATALTITISAGNQGRPTKIWTLTCPDGGTLPRAQRACQRLAAIKDPFAPVPKSAACTEVYGGPDVAEVRGRLGGHKVLARFSRTNGCEIARWNKVRFLFPSG